MLMKMDEINSIGREVFWGPRSVFLNSDDKGRKGSFILAVAPRCLSDKVAFKATPEIYHRPHIMTKTSRLSSKYRNEYLIKSFAIYSGVD